MIHYSFAEEVPSYFSSASDFVNSSAVPSQLIRVFCLETSLQVFLTGRMLLKLAHKVFSSLAVLDPKVDDTMDVLSPFISVLCHSD